MHRTLLFVAVAVALARAETLYVSPEGRGGWSGKLSAPNAAATDGPLPSLEAARDAVRTLRGKAAGPITILLRKGTYRLERPFVLGPEDSGSAEHPVVYAAYPNEHVEICGGRVITGMQHKGAIWTADVPGVRDGSWYFRQLFVNGERAPRARTPNNGFFRADGASSQAKPFQVKYRGSDIKPAWAESGDVEVVSLLAWAEMRSPIARVDEQSHTATLMTDPRPSNKEVDARYYIENTPDALDAHGEWYLDRRNGVLSYKQANAEEPSKSEFVAPALSQLVRIEGRPETGELVRYVTLRGLHFCHTDWSMPAKGFADSQAAITAVSAIEAVGAEHCAFEKCVVAHHGGYGIWFGRGSKRNRVVRNEIYDMGGGGVKIGEIQQRPSDAERNAENAVTDNQIHHLGIVYPSAIGIWVGQSSNNELSHNHIHDLHYTAISVGWTWGYKENQSKGNRIEFNHMHDIGGPTVMSDLACVYTLGMQPGTTIRNNLCHDIDAFTYGGWGIYPDEGSSDILIENNIVYRCKSAGFHQHYGRENIVRNNIFALNTEYELMRTRVEPHVSFIFEGNIVYWEQGRPLGSNWTGDKFRLDRNVYYDAREVPILFAGKTFAEWKEAGHDVNSIIADPRFVDPGNFDFRLQPDSPALKLGFKPIDMRTVGPRPEAPAAVTRSASTK